MGRAPRDTCGFPGERHAVVLGTTFWVVGRPPGPKGEGAMTPRIPLIIGIAVTALAFGVPTALGENALSIEKTRSRVETPKAVPYKPGPVLEGSRAPHSTTAAARGRRRGQARRRADEPDRGLGHALRYRSGVGAARSRSRPRTPPGRRVVPGGADEQDSSALPLMRSSRAGVSIQNSTATVRRGQGRRGVNVSYPPPHSGAVEFVREDYGGDGREGDVGHHRADANA